MNVECELDTEMATVEPATIGEKGGGREHRVTSGQS